MPARRSISPSPKWKRKSAKSTPAGSAARELAVFRNMTGSIWIMALGTKLEIDDELQPIVRTKRFNVKPMGLEEAVEQMELLGHDFFVFHNLEEGNINVLYRRKDGAFGLLAPTEG